MLNQQAQVTKVLSVSESMAVTVDTTPTAYFWCELQKPRGTPPRTVDSPRVDLPPYLLRFAGGAFSPRKDLKAGSRIRLNGKEYECIAAPLDYLWANTTTHKEIQVLPVEDLYPYKCALVDKGDAVPPTQDVPVALWTPSEIIETRGQYADMSGYIPAEEHDLINSNTELLVGATRYTITRSSLDLNSGVVNLTVRRQGRG